MAGNHGFAHRCARPAAVVGLAGAIGYLAIALLQSVDPTAPGEPGFALRNTVSTASALLLIGVVVGLARSGATGGSRPARIGLGTVALGWVTVAAAQAISLPRGDDTIVFVVATLLHVVGMIPVATAVLRARRWSGASRWVPLLCAVYLVGATPLFALPAAGQVAIAGWAGCWLLLGLAVCEALRRQGNSHDRRFSGPVRGWCAGRRARAG